MPFLGLIKQAKIAPAAVYGVRIARRFSTRYMVLKRNPLRSSNGVLLSSSLLIEIAAELHSFVYKLSILHQIKHGSCLTSLC